MVRLVLTAESRHLRRELGLTAWAVLQEVALDATDDAGPMVAAVSARSLASSLGIGKDTAARALARLVDAGVLTRRCGARGTGGAFTRGGYVVHLDSVIGVRVDRADLPSAALAPVGVPTARPPSAPQPVSRRRSPAVAQGALFDLEQPQ